MRLVLAAALLLQALPARPMALYGRDNRRDIGDVPAAGLRALARSVPALFESGKVVVDGETAELRTTPLLDKYPIRPSERFAEQPTGAFCSGVLVAPDRVLTAGHCLRTHACSGLVLVFDYAIREKGQDPTRARAADVYRCSEVLSLRDGSESDWALLALDRPVEGRPPLELERGGVEAGQGVFTIGYPFGLPAKYAGTAVVRETTALGFSSDLDAMSGNSGGPVFDAETRKVVGIVSRGDDFWRQDYDRPGLVTANVLGHEAGAGTIVMDSARIVRALEAARHRSLFGDGEAARFQARLEALTRDLP
jgi:V8-like Glu-specific endopeptidase